MGDVYLELTIANIEDRRKQKELSFLVDTGASRAWIPKTIAKALGIKTIGTIKLELADGTLKFRMNSSTL